MKNPIALLATVTALLPAPQASAQLELALSSLPVGDQNIVTIEIGGGSKFYRLRKP